MEPAAKSNSRSDESFFCFAFKLYANTAIVNRIDIHTIFFKTERQIP